MIAPTDPDRGSDIERGLAAVRGRIAEAARQVGRDPDEVTLVVVTKMFPTSDIEALADLGVRDVGESREQEAAAKHAHLVAAGGPALSWHFIGRLQANKATAVARFADIVHSVDSARLASRLSAGAARAGRDITALVQVSLDAPDEGAGRGGVPPDEVPALADEIERLPGLALGGLMGIGPLGRPARPAFERLAELWRQVRAEHPQAAILSAGMSGDLEDAVEAGATHVRVGRAVLGSRPPLH